MVGHTGTTHFISVESSNVPASEIAYEGNQLDRSLETLGARIDTLVVRLREGGVLKSDSKADFDTASTEEQDISSPLGQRIRTSRMTVESLDVRLSNIIDILAI